MIEQKYIHLVAILLMLFFAEHASAANKHARAEYMSDAATPSGIVLRSFLSKVTYLSTMSRYDAVHKIVDALEMEHDDSGFLAAEDLYDRFEAAYYEMENEIVAMEIRTLCPANMNQRTRKQVYDAFAHADDRGGANRRKATEEASKGVDG